MKIRVADYIADYLHGNGIRDIFTITGGGAIHLNDAFGHHSGLNCIYNHHEQACSMAAESYARLTGNIAAVCVTSGPGGTNAITGVVGGWLDSIPMLIISGQAKFSTCVASTNLPLRQLGDQEVNIVECVRKITKYAVMITEPKEVAYHLEKALYLAKHGRPGPVWLDIPVNVQSAVVETDELAHYDCMEDSSELPPEISDDTIKAVIEKIKEAKKPVILVGSSVRQSGAYDAFLKLIDKLKIPVVTAWNVHDALWDEHPLYCGRPSSVGTRGGNFVVQNSDLLISLGCRMTVRQVSYNWESFAKDAYLIYVDIDEAELKKPTLSVDMPIHGDVREFIGKLLAADFENNSDKHAKWLEWCRKIEKKYPAVREEFFKVKTPVNPYIFMEKLSEHLSEGDVTVASNGSACVCSFQAFRIKKNQRLYTNAGCASMGYGLPASIGAAVALRGQRVVCLEGDGSIQMNLQELQTLVHNKFNIKVVWLNNNGYHSIRQTQMNMFDSNFCGIDPDSGISFPSAEKIAYAYGIEYINISNIDEIDEKINILLSTQGPAICEVVLNPEQLFEPKLSSKVMPDGSIVSPSIEDMYPFLSREEMEENVFKG
ncbi:MAG: thiamine pyrophosphate-binding protein [Clostridia bacterium]|nr:thiamine pyrophosphate-binding protein [Clostridia bacterium]